MYVNYNLYYEKLQHVRVKVLSLEKNLTLLKPAKISSPHIVMVSKNIHRISSVCSFLNNTKKKKEIVGRSIHKHVFIKYYTINLYSLSTCFNLVELDSS